MNPNSSRFFVAGGTLRPNTPSYVERPADAELLEAALAGEFCYVLTPRQMGKSSLMARTARALEARGVQTAIVDLTAVGVTGSQEAWYLGFLAEAQHGLGLATDAAAWWQARGRAGAGASATQRFSAYLREVVLAECPGRVVIFVDEIDSTLTLPFRDDFFAALRALYNARALTPGLERLTFVLLGVAAPTDLIADPARTPFNIGHAIALQEFSRADAAALLPGLEAACPGQGQALLERIYDWTNGYPYLTQKLCLAAVEQAERGEPPRVDDLVQRLFLAEDARNETNLKFVQDKILGHPQRDALLRLYRQVLRGNVPDDAQNPLHNGLKLAGLVKAERGVLCVRNEIYRRVFNLGWVKENIPVKWMPVALAIAVLLIVLLLAPTLDRAWVQRRLNRYVTNFQQAQSPEIQMTNLANLIRLRGLLSREDYTTRARALYYELSPEARAALFADLDSAETLGADVVLVIETLYVTLADVDGSGSTTPILDSMAQRLAEIDETVESIALQRELRAWVNARQRAAAEALDFYDRAIVENARNPATLYERARARMALGKYGEALQDLDQVIACSRKVYPADAGFVNASFATFEQVRGAVWALGRDVPEMAVVLKEASEQYENLQAYDVTEMILGGGKRTRAVDGMTQVYVPAGEFVMGSTDAQFQAAVDMCVTEGYEKSVCEDTFKDEQPAHTVVLDAFWLDQTEVTNAQYQQCVAAGACTPSSCAGDTDFNGDSQPVVCVDWYSAVAYCAWVGGFLPTEAQWEYAARGPEGRVYPWGNTFDGTRANFCDAQCEFAWANQMYDDGYARTASVGSFPAGASWAGALDMAGNVWEWTNDWYGRYSSERQENPTGPATGEYRVLRGGAWTTHAYGLRSTYRSGYVPTFTSDLVGLRCGGAGSEGE